MLFLFAFIIDDEVIVMKNVRTAFPAISARFLRFLPSLISSSVPSFSAPSPFALASFVLAGLMFLTALSEPALAQADFHIGLMTGTVSAAEDSLRGAESLINRYGSAENGGMILHVTYPDQFISEMETTIGQIVGLADDPKMKAIVVSHGIPGTTEGFRRVRERRPDILLFVGEAHEDLNVVASAADLVVNADSFSRGYLIPLAAKEVGAKNFVHISFPRHMSFETLGRRRAIMEEACRDLGLSFYAESAPDPLSDVGVAGAQQFILEKMPVWLKKYGRDTAFLCTNYTHIEPMLTRVIEQGGYVVDLFSPIMGLPGALGIDLSREKGNWPAILKKVERFVVEAGAGGRIGTGAFSYDYTNVVALAEFGKRCIEGKARLESLTDLRACYELHTPGAHWSAIHYVDAGTGIRLKNVVLVNQDIYILGRGYFGITETKVPEKYFRIGAFPRRSDGADAQRR